MELYCVSVVLDCLRRSEDNTFYKGLFKQAVTAMKPAEFHLLMSAIPAPVSCSHLARLVGQTQKA